MYKAKKKMCCFQTACNTLNIKKKALPWQLMAFVVSIHVSWHAKILAVSFRGG